MKFTYAYKSSDGVRHEAAIEAESRDEVFQLLRGRGIRPIKVVAADGSKANGEVRGLRKRAVFALVALAALVAGVVAYLGGERTGAATASSSAASAPRHQIYERTRRELEKETSEEVWEQKNDALRRLGLRTIPNPGE